MVSDLARLVSERPLVEVDLMPAVEIQAFVSFLFCLSVTAPAWPAYRSSLTQAARTSEQPWPVRRALIHSRPAAVSRWKPTQVWQPERLGTLRLFADCPRAVARWLCVLVP